MQQKKSSLLLFVFVYLSFYAKAHNPSWTDGIACIIYSHCTNCHNPNGIAPFSLLTYNDVYANRLSIAASVQAKSMPPFPASQEKRKYAHANTLSQHEIDEIVDWVSNFAPLGNAGQIPTPPTYSHNYQLLNPDVVLKIPNYTVNTTSDLYRCFTLPLNNTNQQYIQEIEVVPGNRDIVHHALVFQDTSLIPYNLDLADPLPGYNAFGSTGSSSSKLVMGYTPGQGSYAFPTGFGARVLQNSYIVIQIHYPGGISNQLDSTQVRIKYGSGTLRNIQTNAILNHVNTLTNGPLIINPNQIKTFYNQFTMPSNITITGVMPHMHLLGKSIKSFAVTPLGDSIHIVDIPVWDFHWQGFYQFQKPILIPSGSTLYGEATYDNTINNLNNPNTPPDTVFQGEGTADEMFLVYFNYTPYQNGDTSLIVDTSSHILHSETCSPTNVSSILNEEIIKVFPNPATQTLNIEGNKIFGYAMLLNSYGATVRRIKVQKKATMTIESLPKGIYFLHLQTESGTNIYKKIIKD